MSMNPNPSGPHLSPPSPGLFQDLERRGIVYQTTDPQMGRFLDEHQVTVYLGFDPTSDSLHIGNLLGLVTLKRFQKAGHKIIALVGGATGFIGDPSGKTQERTLLSQSQLEHNVEGISKVISRFIDWSAPGTSLVNNLDWLGNLSMIDFLKDVGKHFTVNYMLDKDSVKSRLQNREHGISFTEFSYMMLQAYDFYILQKKLGCNVQLGGADQWGNITAGIELIRRKAAAQQTPLQPAFGLTWPILTKADGTKFGKTESGSIWLSAEKTSPYDFYQYFVRVGDEEVIPLLKYLTFFSLEEIAALEQSLKKSPEKREAQNALAFAVTTLVHGEQEAQKAKDASGSFFASNLSQMDAQSLEALIRNAPSTIKSRAMLDAGLPLIELLVETKLSSSKGQARTDIQGGGIYLNQERVDQTQFKVGPENLIQSQYLILRKGKKTYHTVIFQE